MAVNQSRSMNFDLNKGMYDGVIKSLTPDRGGEVETDAVTQRAESLQAQYSFTDNQHSFASDCGCDYCSS